MASSKIIQGSLSGIILTLLSQHGRMYGYEMTQAVREQTAGKLQLTEAALYPALHKLLEVGLLQTETKLVSGRPRKYYRIARENQKASVQLIESLQESLETLQNLLHGKGPATV